MPTSSQITYKPYEFKLDEKFKKIALEELFEDDHRREQSLHEMREWIAKHPYIKFCNTEATFLLKFLRQKKFSVPRACKYLERYLIMRQKVPQWMNHVNVHEPAILEILDAGATFPLLERDSHGRHVYFTIIDRVDIEKENNFVNMTRAHMLHAESAILDERTQIVGLHHICDARGLGLKHLVVWPLLELMEAHKHAFSSFPVRHSVVTIITTHGHKLIDMGLVYAPRKLRDRLNVIKDVADLSKYIDVKILPKEYGGIVPIEEMVEKFKEDLEEKEKKILDLDNLEIDISHFKSDWEHEVGVIGSFRSLQVD